MQVASLMDDLFRTIRFKAYCRRSSESDERQMLSVPSQTDWVARETARRGIALRASEIVEESKSAKEPGRPGFSSLLDEVERGEVQGILSWHPDRLSRNALDTARVIHLMDVGKLQAVITQQSVFTNTPMDKFFLAMLMLQAKMENEHKSDNVRRGLKKKWATGTPTGSAKIGFANDLSKEKGNRGWIVDRERFPLVKLLLERFLEGTTSVYQLWSVAREELHLTTVPRKRIGGKLITLSHMYRMLSEPVYAGFFYAGGKRYELTETLPRMISEDQYWTIQAMLGRKGQPRPQKRRNGLYNYFMRDASGGGTTADHKFQLICSACRKKFSYINRDDCPQCGIAIESMHKPRYLRYVYYQSTKEKRTRGVKAKAIEEKKIDRFLGKYFRENLAISQELSSWCIHNLELLADREVETYQLSVQSRREARERVQGKLNRLLDLRLRKAEHSPDEEELYDRKEATLRRELQTLEGKSAGSDTNWLAEARRQFLVASDVLEHFEDSSLEAKKDALAALASNLTLDSGSVSIVNAKSVEAFISGMRRSRRENPAFEPRKCVDTTRRNQVFASVIPRMLRTLENVRTALLEEADERACVQEAKFIKKNGNSSP